MGAFALHGRYIGTIRLIPLGVGLAPCEGVIARHPQLPSQLQEDGWEVGRLVLHPEHRSPEMLKNCFNLTLMRFIESFPTANFFATCSPILARLYRRAGFSVLVKDACTGDDGESFCLIHGNVDSVRLAVAKESAGMGVAQ